MSTSPNISEWVKAAQAGEEAAWNMLHQQYYPGIYAIALRLCGNPDTAKDVVQDTFMTAYMKLGQLKDVAAFGGWIKKIVTHISFRIQHRHLVHEPLETISAESDGWWEDELNRKLDWLSTQSQLYVTLAHLPESLRSTVLLRYFSDFQSYEEIARILSVPVGTIRSRLNQAKLKLSEQWKQNADIDMKFIKEREEWTGFYYSTFAGMHKHDDSKNQFINHLQKDVQIISPGGKLNTGRMVFEKMIVDDREFGSWLTPANVTSSGNISIIEAKHFNSTEFPHHCPPRSVLVLYRNKEGVMKINFHPSFQ